MRKEAMLKLLVGLIALSVLSCSSEKVVDYLNVAWGWLEAAHRLEPPARFPCRAHRSATPRPTSVEPVKEIRATSGWRCPPSPCAGRACR